MNRRRVSTQVLLYFFMLMLLMFTVGCSKSDVVAPGTATPYSISGTVSGAVAANVMIRLNGYYGYKDNTDKTDKDGTYIFKGLKNGGTYTVTPILTGYMFNPASKVVVITGSNNDCRLCCNILYRCYL